MNSKGHLFVSIAKSVIRIASCCTALIVGSVKALAAGFAAAEILGVAEELVDKR